MKITIITGPFSSIPPNTIGDVERLWYNIACVMTQKGHDIFFVSKRDSPIDQNGNNVDGIYVDYIKGFKSKKHIVRTVFYDFFYSVKALWQMKKCDVLVMNTFWTPVLCILFKYKYKVSVYNVERIPKGQFKLYKHVDRLSCVSIIVGDILAKQTPSVKNKIKIINNPVNTDVFYSKHNNRTDNFIKLIYTGRVHPEKGLDILVKSFCKLKAEYTNLQLSIVGARDIAHGGGGQEYINRLNSLAGNYKINFIDPIYMPQQLRDEIMSHDIFCYPSVAEKGETFGVAPLEAMATGIPTILSALECFKDFAKDRENALIFNHRSPRPEIELCDSIRKLIDNKDFREKIALNGAKTAKRFSTEKIAEEYIQDFKYLLENSIKNG
jgi:glycosyltransferase involved in cell wall biosynthesis